MDKINIWTVYLFEINLAGLILSKFSEHLFKLCYQKYSSVK